jgi:hypothetical protein
MNAQDNKKFIVTTNKKNFFYLQILFAQSVIWNFKYRFESYSLGQIV